jgi:cytochrome c
MNSFLRRSFSALALVGLIGAAAADEQSGRQVFERRCRGCHGGTSAPADLPIGPRLNGIVGSKAGPGDHGVHSRAVIDSTTVWDRDSLRRFLTDPQREIPGTLMAVRVSDAAELESLLDYLESLR